MSSLIVIDLHPNTRQLLERLIVALERREDVAFIPTEPSRSSAAGEASCSPTVQKFPPFSLRRGEQIYGASQEDLRFYANASLRELRDSSKRRFHAQEHERLNAYNAELRRQGALPVNEGAS